MLKRKQRLYEKYFKKRSDKNNETYKIYKLVFQKLKKTVKKALFSKKIKTVWKQYQKHLECHEAVKGKSKICNDKFPKRLDINKEEITDKKNYSRTVQ